MDRLFSFVATLFPNRCAQCLGNTAHYLCPDCINHLTINATPCLQCGLPLHQSQVHCGDCQTFKKPFTATLSPFIYQKSLATLLQQFKSNNPAPLINSLGHEWLNGIEKAYAAASLPDFLVPVPMHWAKRWRRGFNQAHYLCEYLQANTAIPIANVARITQYNRAQKQLNRTQRLANLKNAFRVPPKLRSGIAEKHLAIVDDVITTCATAVSLTECLLQAGASRVDVWALARTPKPGK